MRRARGPDGSKMDACSGGEGGGGVWWITKYYWCDLRPIWVGPKEAAAVQDGECESRAQPEQGEPGRGVRAEKSSKIVRLDDGM